MGLIRIKKQLQGRVQEILHLVLVLFGVSALVFFMSQFVSGDIAETIVINRGLEPSRQEIEHVKDELGLNDPLTVQYQRWIQAVLRGDFGVSYRSHQPVMHEISARIPQTLILAISSAVLTIGITFMLCMDSVLNRKGIGKKLCTILVVLGTSVPSFVIALGLIYLFAIQLQWFQITQTNTIVDYILPVLTLSLSILPSSLRVFQTSLIENSQQTFVSVLKSRGFSMKHILYKDVLNVSIGPWLTQFSVTMGHLLGGSVIVETIFGIGGLGQFMVSSILNRDYPVIQAYVIIMGVIFVLLHFGVEMILRSLYPYRYLAQGDPL